MDMKRNILTIFISFLFVKKKELLQTKTKDSEKFFLIMNLYNYI